MSAWDRLAEIYIRCERWELNLHFGKAFMHEPRILR